MTDAGSSSAVPVVPAPAAAGQGAIQASYFSLQIPAFMRHKIFLMLVLLIGVAAGCYFLYQHYTQVSRQNTMLRMANDDLMHQLRDAKQILTLMTPQYDDDEDEDEGEEEDEEEEEEEAPPKPEKEKKRRPPPPPPPPAKRRPPPPPPAVRSDAVDPLFFLMNAPGVADIREIGEDEESAAPPAAGDGEAGATLNNILLSAAVAAAPPKKSGTSRKKKPAQAE